MYCRCCARTVPLSELRKGHAGRIVKGKDFRKSHARDWTGMVWLGNIMPARNSKSRKRRPRRERLRAHRRVPMEEKLLRAFQLAYFILCDKQAALRVTREAVASLDIALAAQDKRLYYAPGSRAAQSGVQSNASAHFRTKVNLSELQMLQRLVYIAAEPEERRKEAAGIPQAAWLIHYLKHLTRITLKRNSFFVTLGVSRLLHNYTTPETMQIYEMVVQDPARGRDDSYYRRRKAQLVRELQERFGEGLTLQRGLRGEERFQALQEAQLYRELVGDCLRTFTPWETNCCVPSAFDPRRDELPPLRFRGNNPDAEHSVETSRFHAVLHPDCYQHLLAALRLESPTQRLELPQFHAPNGDPPPNNGGPPNRSRSAADLSEEEMKSIKDYVERQREQRKRFSPAWLRVVVDGAVRAQSTPAQPAHLSLAVASGAELIEVYGLTVAEELRLAAHLLSYDEEENLLPATAKLVLEGGQQLTFNVQPQRDATGQDAGALVTVDYKETAPTRALRLWLQRQRWRLFQTVPGALPTSMWKPALAFTLLTVFGAALVYALLVRPAPSRDELALTMPTPPASPSVTPTTSPLPQPSATMAPTPRLSPPASDDVIAMDIRSRGGGDPAEALTRSKRAEAVGLLRAKKVYLEISGAEQLRQTISEQLAQWLQADSKFKLIGNQDEADIALKVVVTAGRKDGIVLTAGLVDANGNVIWPLTPGASRRRYEGPTEKTIATFSRELANDIKQLERKQK